MLGKPLSPQINWQIDYDIYISYVIIFLFHLCCQEVWSSISCPILAITLSLFFWYNYLPILTIHFMVVLLMKWFFSYCVISYGKARVIMFHRNNGYPAEANKLHPCMWSILKDNFQNGDHDSYKYSMNICQKFYATHKRF